MGRKPEEHCNQKGAWCCQDTQLGQAADATESGVRAREGLGGVNEWVWLGNRGRGSAKMLNWTSCRCHWAREGLVGVNEWVWLGRSFGGGGVGYLYWTCVRLCISQLLTCSS